MLFKLPHLLLFLLSLVALSSVTAAPTLIPHGLDELQQEFDRRRNDLVEGSLERRVPPARRPSLSSAGAAGHAPAQQQPLAGALNPSTQHPAPPLPAAGSAAGAPQNQAQDVNAAHSQGSEVGTPAKSAPQSQITKDAYPGQNPDLYSFSAPNKPAGSSHPDTALEDAKAGYKGMKEAHDSFKESNKGKPGNGKKTMPKVVSTLTTPDGQSFTHSSVKGNRNPDPSKTDPSHIHDGPAKELINYCDREFGPSHTNAANCGEIRNTQAYHDANPGVTHVPEGSKYAAVDGNGLKAPCDTEKAGRGWGCKEYTTLAMIPPGERDKAAERLRGEQSYRKEKTPTKMADPSTSGTKPAGQSQKQRRSVVDKRGMRYPALLRRKALEQALAGRYILAAF